MASFLLPFIRPFVLADPTVLLREPKGSVFFIYVQMAQRVSRLVALLMLLIFDDKQSMWIYSGLAVHFSLSFKVHGMPPVVRFNAVEESIACVLQPLVL